MNKAIEVVILVKRMYPQWSVPNDLALAYYLVGESEQVIPESRESIRLNPQFAAPYGYLALALLRLNRFAEATDVRLRILVSNRRSCRDH